MTAPSWQPPEDGRSDGVDHAPLDRLSPNDMEHWTRSVSTRLRAALDPRTFPRPVAFWRARPALSGLDWQGVGIDLCGTVPAGAQAEHVVRELGRAIQQADPMMFAELPIPPTWIVGWSASTRTPFAAHGWTVDVSGLFVRVTRQYDLSLDRVIVTVGVLLGRAA